MNSYNLLFESTNACSKQGMRLALYLCLFLNLLTIALTYTIPDPKVELLVPKGVRISIPDENGIALVGYHVNINKPIALLEKGDYSADISIPTDGRWNFDIRNAFVDPDDKINFWIQVQYLTSALRKLGSAIAPCNAVNLSEPEPQPYSEPGTTGNHSNWVDNKKISYIILFLVVEQIVGN